MQTWLFFFENIVDVSIKFTISFKILKHQHRNFTISYRHYFFLTYLTCIVQAKNSFCKFSRFKRSVLHRYLEFNRDEVISIFPLGKTHRMSGESYIWSFFSSKRSRRVAELLILWDKKGPATSRFVISREKHLRCVEIKFSKKCNF